MYYTCTVLDCHIITRDDLEGTLSRIEPRDELFISYTCQFASLHSAVKHLERHKLVARLIILESHLSCLCIEVGVHKSLSHHIKCRLTCVWIERKNTHIVDVRSYAERSI